jgi:hypothetical protein
VQLGRRAVDALGGGTLRIVDPGMAALGDHRFVVVEKGEPTLDDYPRRPGVPQRRPLGRASAPVQSRRVRGVH